MPRNSERITLREIPFSDRMSMRAALSMARTIKADRLACSKAWEPSPEPEPCSVPEPYPEPDEGNDLPRTPKFPHAVVFNFSDLRSPKVL